MDIDLIAIGKTDAPEIAALIADYAKRIGRYAKFSVVFLPDVRTSRKLPAEQQKQSEGELLLRQFGPGDTVVLLDEKGEEMRSVEFASWLERRLAAGGRRICFVIGGPYGFSKAVYDRADALLSLSRMTFSHQIIRAIFARASSRWPPVVSLGVLRPKTTNPNLKMKKPFRMSSEN